MFSHLVAELRQNLSDLRKQNDDLTTERDVYQLEHELLQKSDSQIEELNIEISKLRSQLSEVRSLQQVGPTHMPPNIQTTEAITQTLQDLQIDDVQMSELKNELKQKGTFYYIFKINNFHKIFSRLIYFEIECLYKYFLF